MAVLPLLREQEGSGGQSQTSSAEERVIGAGLKALERHEDGAAVKALFHMFAVTMEDFVHPMAVIELLWRSCCASDAEKQEGSLTTRLKVRQWTQMLVDHSLLLGSSSEGIHLHDIVLQYLRKRLSAEEMRAEQTKVVEGMIAASEARMAATGRGLQDTGVTSKPFAGEEIDWYCCNVGPYHVQCVRDPAVGVADDESIQRWLLGFDPVLVRAAATAVGLEGLSTLVAHFLREEEALRAAKLEWASATVVGGIVTEVGRAHVKAALALIEDHSLATLEAQRLELAMRAAAGGIQAKGFDRKAQRKRMKELLANNPKELTLDALDMAVGMVYMPNSHLIGASTSTWVAGQMTITTESVLKWHAVFLKEFIPLVARAESESVGARREYLGALRAAFCGFYLPIAGSERAAAMVHGFLASEEGWGPAAKRLMEASAMYAHKRHNAIAATLGARMDQFLITPLAVAVLEHGGDLQQAEVLFTRQLRAVHAHRIERSSTSLDLSMYFNYCALCSRAMRSCADLASPSGRSPSGPAEKRV